MIQELKYKSASLSAYDYCIVHMNNKTVINNDNTKLDWVNWNRKIEKKVLLNTFHAKYH